MDLHPLRALGLLLGVVVAAVVGYLGVVTGQVLLGAKGDAGEGDAGEPAGAIVVLGAAQYDGVPSPALRQRLERALALWEDETAPLIVVTGGGQPGDRFNEATAARTWLHERGVPDADIRREVRGRNTYDQLAATARFLDREGVEDVVLVSHRLHSARLRMIADEVGLQAKVSPTPSQGIATRTARLAAREIGAVAAGQVIGFRRLRNLMTDDTAPG